MGVADVQHRACGRTGVLQEVLQGPGQRLLQNQACQQHRLVQLTPRVDLCKLKHQQQHRRQGYVRKQLAQRVPSLVVHTCEAGVLQERRLLHGKGSVMIRVVLFVSMWLLRWQRA